jgi:hypothetical protein
MMPGLMLIQHFSGLIEHYLLSISIGLCAALTDLFKIWEWSQKNERRIKDAVTFTVTFLNIFLLHLNINNLSIN